MLDQFETTAGESEKIQVWSGAAPANCATAASGTKLAEWDLASSGDWAAAAGGAKTVNSLPISSTAVGTGTAGYFRIYDSTGTNCHMQGTVTATGGGGDMTVDNTSIATGQTVNLTGFTLTAPGA